ncbi:hypothetical protein K1719_046752 [Acacia pycnantha]|nr:hypothetical protein K1719_046752 [Acacia pycnantha]
MASALRLHALILSLFLFGLTTTSLASNLLHDIDGNLLENGGLYYILPAHSEKGGGLELASTESESCPRTVVQARSQDSKGLPARLASPVLMLTLGPGFPLTIEFHHQNPPSCLHHSRLQWTVDRESKLVKIAYREEEQMFGPFQIQPHGDDSYKLVHCERQSRNNHDCKDLGLSTDDENNMQFLVVKDGDPLLVKFKKDDHRDNQYLAE